MKVMTNGIFDLLHEGHLRLLECCRTLAGPEGHVIVALNSNRSVAAMKGAGRPVQPHRVRELSLRALRYVDDVRIFTEESELNSLIKQLAPDIYVKGADSYGKWAPNPDHVGMFLYVEHGIQIHTSDVIREIRKCPA